MAPRSPVDRLCAHSNALERSKSQMFQKPPSQVQMVAPLLPCRGAEVGPMQGVHVTSMQGSAKTGMECYATPQSMGIGEVLEKLEILPSGPA